MRREFQVVPLPQPEEIQRLNAFLRGERAAVEAYSRAISLLEQVDPVLYDARASHIARVDLLSRHVWRMGGIPGSRSGAWGGLVRGLTGLASVVDDTAVLRLLAEGEDRGLGSYLERSQQLSARSRAFVHHELLPRQYRSHDLIHDLLVSVPA